MLDLTRMIIKETVDYDHDQTTMDGTLLLSARINADSGRLKYEPKMREFLHKELRGMIHRIAYGELLRPFAELDSYALKYSPPTDHIRVRELSDNLRQMLSYDFKGEVVLKESPLNEREIFWLSVKNVIEKLPRDWRIGIVQELIQKTGPCPDSMGATIQNILASD